MQSIGEILLGRSGLRSPEKSSFDAAIAEEMALTPEERHARVLERTKRAVEAYNASCGGLDADGYKCAKCNNRGDFAAVSERYGCITETHYPCECMKIRRSIQLIRASGLADAIKRNTFKTFAVSESWQEQMLTTARRFVTADDAWMFLGGAVGSGKTHICTAACRELMYAGKALHYMRWVDDGAKIKALVNDDAAYGEEVGRLKNIEVLYIDDFLKPVMSKDGNTLPTSADVKLAYEILNARYINRLPTIISSERYLEEIIGIDEAVGSRICEMARGYTLRLTRGTVKNMRLEVTQ